VGALGQVNGSRLELQALVAAPNGRRLIRVTGSAPIADARRLGQQLAAEALARGAAQLLEG
jgi:hydroxymethylbilane synthase